MPSIKWWFGIVYAFIIAFAGAASVALAESAGVLPRLTSWLIILLAGLVAAAERGYASWPTEPVRTWHPPPHFVQEEP